MKVWLFYPPLKSMSGGCHVLLQIARQMQTAGVLGAVLCWETPPAHTSDLPWTRAAEAPMRAGDVLIVPEGWPNALALGFRAGCRSFVYCQNWAYLFLGLEQRWRDLPVEFLAVSDPVAWHMEQVLGQRPAILRPAIDANVFFPSAERLSGRTGPQRIAFMPRKNKALAEHVRRIFEERNPATPVDWIPIHGLDQAGVAATLRSCDVFLATGFPEGCPLPPLEALACGCLCVGFAGFGGWDYMRQMEEGGFAPHRYQLRSVPWGGNGWWFADGDVLGAALGLERALASDISALQTAQAAAAYGHKAQQLEVREFLKTL